jgi:hypothetical protein
LLVGFGYGITYSIELYCTLPPQTLQYNSLKPGWLEGKPERIHELYSMILESKSIIQTNKHRSTYFFAEDVLHRPSDFEVKASAVKTKNARLYKAGILLEKQQE